jgi:hypothetical protein
MHYSSVPSGYSGQGKKKKKNVTQLSLQLNTTMLCYIFRKRALSIDNSIKTCAIRYVPQVMGGEHLT